MTPKLHAMLLSWLDDPKRRAHALARLSWDDALSYDGPVLRHPTQEERDAARAAALLRQYPPDNPYGVRRGCCGG